MQRDLAALGGAKWVERENLHLTLKFLGDVERERLPALVERLARAAAGASPTSLTAARVSAFPNERSARVLVVELEDPGGVIAGLQGVIDRELAAAGVVADDRPFRTHLTLGRVKAGPQDARRALGAASLPAGEWRVDRFELIESQLGPAGPSYTVLESFSLGAGRLPRLRD